MAEFVGRCIYSIEYRVEREFLPLPGFSTEYDVVPQGSPPPLTHTELVSVTYQDTIRNSESLEDHDLYSGSIDGVLWRVFLSAIAHRLTLNEIHAMHSRKGTLPWENTSRDVMERQPVQSNGDDSHAYYSYYLYRCMVRSPVVARYIEAGEDDEPDSEPDEPDSDPDEPTDPSDLA
jgi:hypothetical protein